jgi:feruloyl esterase
VDWVEKGVAPGHIAGAGARQNATVMTRLHCPYQQTAKYKGDGDPGRAENFACK